MSIGWWIGAHNLGKNLSKRFFLFYVLHAYDGTIFVKRISETKYIVYPSSIPPGNSPHSFSVIRRKWRLNDGNGCNHIYADVSELGKHQRGLVRLYPTRYE